jgi:hypothetical protein
VRHHRIMSEDLRPSPEERHRRAILVMWLLLVPPSAVAGVLVAMVWFSGKPTALLWVALAIFVTTMIAFAFASHYYIQGGAKGRAPDWRYRNVRS